MDASFNLILGLGFFAGGGWATYMSISSLSWVQTRGQVIEREIKRNWRDITSVEVEITYTFEVDDYNFVSSNYKPGIVRKYILTLPFLRKEYFAETRFEKGSEVDVFYDPKNPRRCALVPGDFVVPVLALIAGLAMLCWEANSYFKFVAV